ncbi:macro domain-containing protein [Actinomadura sp. NEAU-AAG7]|uniref:macro domain-containing protein n=1 Tax=Actinomadura sp. NEAU-AAG7 TaxID=2839640 RepID=UPI001BE3EC60|nr:macro domain-containing protein [Actinomadura sp. NEAU-AAG7]MBT2213778.1 hypothetical protein [Actinomadura sp. NEAU-AAG7]
MTRQELRETFFTRQGVGAIAVAALAAFGLVSAAFQVALALWPRLIRHDWLVLSSLAACCIFVGTVHAWPRLRYSRTYNHPNFVIQVKCGDLLEEEGNIVVGFTDTFDTDMTDGIVIDHRSVQGQFQSKYYNNIAQLDAEIDDYLRDRPAAAMESLASKPKGKLKRHEIGTVVVLRRGNSKYFASAYGYMRNDLRVTCSVDALWKTLTAIWEAVRTHGSLDPVAIPVIGSDLARVGTLDRNSIIKMIALSFIASTRQEIVSRQLTIVIHPKDRQAVNLIDIYQFLRAL